MNLFIFIGRVLRESDSVVFVGMEPSGLKHLALSRAGGVFANALYGGDALGILLGFSATTVTPLAPTTHRKPFTRSTINANQNTRECFTKEVCTPEGIRSFACVTSIFFLYD